MEKFKQGEHATIWFWGEKRSGIISQDQGVSNIVFVRLENDRVIFYNAESVERA